MRRRPTSDRRVPVLSGAAVRWKHGATCALHVFKTCHPSHDGESVNPLPDVGACAETAQIRPSCFTYWLLSAVSPKEPDWLRGEQVSWFHEQKSPHPLRCCGSWSLAMKTSTKTKVSTVLANAVDTAPRVLDFSCSAKNLAWGNRPLSSFATLASRHSKCRRFFSWMPFIGTLAKCVR